ncbi:MAG: hypothetical protein Q8P81_03745 [Nanoarchaeota archaeon]|nr:hypothetical protein [Nanoarchaeota archaeon]
MRKSKDKGKSNTKAILFKVSEDVHKVLMEHARIKDISLSETIINHLQVDDIQKETMETYKKLLKAGGSNE